MDVVRINPADLNGTVRVPPSKSLSHRAIICAGLAEGISSIDNIVFSEDINVTLRAVEGFGAEVVHREHNKEYGHFAVTIKGNPRPYRRDATVFCGESGSTLRFFIPFAGLTAQKITFTGEGKLVERPLKAYYEIFDAQGIEYTNTGGGLPLTVKGTLKPGTFSIEGDVSSQFITGLMFVLPLLDGDSVIYVKGPLQSKGYVALTLNMLQKFGIDIKNDRFKRFYIKGNQRYKSTDCCVEGDYSQAAFWLVAGLLGGGGINCKCMNLKSAQGDRAILDIIKRMRGRIETGYADAGEGTPKAGFVQAFPSVTCGTDIDVSQCPDIMPVIAVLGALSSGRTRIKNAKRLRIKESDRLKAMATELRKLGADVTELKEGLVIEGKELLKGGRVHGWNDHRIVMALAIASIRCEEPVFIAGGSAVKKSYPHFWKDFLGLGGKASF